ncbi:hypothetical protein F4777DRAFT_387753 [Nemania sp. FL0916]|nr:hypothetical protein F4777DRAFT_387753 [Nemania sp. FL0916]
MQRVGYRDRPLNGTQHSSGKQKRPSTQRSISEPILQQSAKQKLARVAAITPMTSFPRLISRSCTNDWLTPLGLFDEIESGELFGCQTMISELYSRGVDAHSGVGIYDPLPVLEERSHTNSTSLSRSPLQTHLSSTLENENHCSFKAEDEGQRMSRKLGCSMGVASHKRIGQRVQHDQHKGANENIFGGLDNYNLIPKWEQTLDQLAQPSWTEIAVEESRERKRSSRDLLQGILQKSELSTTNLRRSKASPRAQRTIQQGKCSERRGKCPRLPCSEDGEPHVCLDDQSSLGNE